MVGNFHFVPEDFTFLRDTKIENLTILSIQEIKEQGFYSNPFKIIIHFNAGNKVLGVVHKNLGKTSMDLRFIPTCQKA